MQTIKRGSKNEDVKVLQEALGILADGVFGLATERAVKAFQQAHGLTADGVVGTKTWGLLIPNNSIIHRRKINKIIIHCTATLDGQDWTVDQIRQFHVKERGWKDIGYHYVIYRDGSVHKGRDVDVIGAHCTGQNTDSIGIVYVGGLIKGSNGNTIPCDTRTSEQKDALRKLVNKLSNLYGLSRKDVYGHNEFANKACPCFNVKKEYRS